MPQIPFERVAREILGTEHELSLVLCGDALARKMNRRYRLPALKLRQAGKKSYAANVLSFPLSKSEGEIFLNIRAAEREAKRFGVPVRERLILLFAHGCLHLQGRKHGKNMEREEARLVKTFR